MIALQLVTELKDFFLYSVVILSTPPHPTPLQSLSPWLDCNPQAVRDRVCFIAHYVSPHAGQVAGRCRDRRTHWLPGMWWWHPCGSFSGLPNAVFSASCCLYLRPQLLSEFSTSPPLFTVLTSCGFPATDAQSISCELCLFMAVLFWLCNLLVAWPWATWGWKRFIVRVKFYYGHLYDTCGSVLTFRS